MELCSGKDLEVIQLHFPTKTKTIISQSCIPDHSSLWILKVELIYFPHSVCINSLWIDPAFFLFTYYHGPPSFPYICHAPLLNSDPNDNIFLMRKWHTEQTIVNFQHLKTAVITLSVVSTPVRGYNWKMLVKN